MISRYVWSIALIGLMGPPVLGFQGFRYPASGATTVANFVRAMFFVSQSSGSAVLRGTCKDTEEECGVLSDGISEPPLGPFQNLGEAFSALSMRAPHISWRRDEEGLMRVRDDRATAGVLRVRLKRVQFKSVVLQDDAIGEIMAAPEVLAYLNDNHIEGGSVASHLEPASTRGLRKLSAELRDVTVAQALDQVVKFFPGMWTYVECSDGPIKRLVVSGETVAWPVQPTARAGRMPEP